MNQGRVHRPCPAWLQRAALLLTTLLGLLALYRFSATAAVYLPFSHIDGAFQTASGLFRLQAGQLPGRDFFPYLGVGTLLSVYPPFLLYGGDFAASIAGAHLAVGLAQGLALAVVLYLCLGGRRWLGAVAVGMLAASAGLLWNEPPGLIAERLSPGNSLRPLRSALPYLAVLAVYWALLRQHRLAHLVLGLTAGAAMIWSNDFALPTAFGCGLAALYCLVQTRARLMVWVHSAALFLLGVGLGLIPVMLATAGHLPALLGFNFIDVAGDQWWYFGPWNEEARIFGPRDLWRLFDGPTLAALAVLVGTLIAALAGRQSHWQALFWLGSVLLLGGMLASIGGHLGGYFPPFQFWALLTLAGLASRAVARMLRPLPGSGWVVGALGLSAGAWVALAAHHQGAETNRLAQADQAHFQVPELGGYIHRDWEPYIELIRQSDPADAVFEEYWGIWSAMRRPTPLLPVDSAIHALGRLRGAAEQVMASRPEWVVTTLPHGWQTWSLSANYWLYRSLLEEYEAVMTSPATVLWRRQRQPLDWQPLACSISADGRSVRVDALDRGYYELELTHHPLPSGRRISLLRTDAVDAFHGWAALQPGRSQSRLPAFAPAAGLHEHPTRVLPARAGIGLELTGCRARRMSRQDPRLFASAAAAYPITDAVWDRGLAREEPLMRVVETLDNRRRLVPGARIRPTEDEPWRRILEAHSHPPWLDVRFEGEAAAPSEPSGLVRFELEGRGDSPTPTAISPGERRPF